MKHSDKIVVFVTASSEEEASNIANRLLEHGKAACVNIVSEVDSFFWWQDKLDSSKEKLLIIKSKESVLPDIIKLVKDIHSYKVPEIIALPIVGGNEDYLEWIDTEVKD